MVLARPIHLRSHSIYPRRHRYPPFKLYDLPGRPQVDFAALGVTWLPLGAPLHNASQRHEREQCEYGNSAHSSAHPYQPTGTRLC